MTDITLDASTPSYVNGVESATTASFTPPAGSLLVVLASAGGSVSPTISNTGSGLTWTQRLAWNASGTNDARGVVYTAPVTASQSYQVTASTTVSSRRASIKVLVFTGADTANPAGASNTGSTNTSNVTVNGYTSTVDRSRGVALAIDCVANPNGTSSDEFQSFRTFGDHGGLVVWKAANTAAAGTTVTFNFNGTSARQWRWGALEILPQSVEIVQGVGRSTAALTPTVAARKLAQVTARSSAATTGSAIVAKTVAHPLIVSLAATAAGSTTKTATSATSAALSALEQVTAAKQLPATGAAPLISAAIAGVLKSAPSTGIAAIVLHARAGLLPLTAVTAASGLALASRSTITKTAPVDGVTALVSAADNVAAKQAPGGGTTPFALAARRFQADTRAVTAVAVVIAAAQGVCVKRVPVLAHVHAALATVTGVRHIATPSTVASSSLTTSGVVGHLASVSARGPLSMQGGSVSVHVARVGALTTVVFTTFRGIPHMSRGAMTPLFRVSAEAAQRSRPGASSTVRPRAGVVVQAGDRNSPHMTGGGG